MRYIKIIILLLLGLNVSAQPLLVGGVKSLVNNGIILNSGALQLGNPMGSTSAQLTRGTEIPLNGKKLAFSGAGQVIIGDTLSRVQSAMLTTDSKLNINNLSNTAVVNSPLITVYDSLTTTQTNMFVSSLYPKTQSSEFPSFNTLFQYYPNVGGAGYNNLIYSRGWNVGTSGRINTSMPATRENIEMKYDVSGHGFVTEWWRSFQAINGVESRFEYVIANRDSLYNSTHNFSSRIHSWYTMNARSGTDLESMVLSSPRYAAQGGVTLQLLPGNGDGTVIQTFGGTTSFSNKIKMFRPTGVTGSGTADDILTYSTINNKGVALLGSISSWAGIQSERFYMNTGGGKMAITRGAGSNFTIHIGTTTASSLFADQVGAVMQINGGVGYQDEFPLSGSSNDLLRLKNINSSNRTWGLSVDASGLGFSKAATAGRFSMMLQDSIDATLYNLAVFGKVGLRVPAGQTSHRSSTPVRGDFRMNLQTRGFEGVRVGTTYEKFFQLGDTLGATAGQVLTYNSGVWAPATNTSEGTTIGAFQSSGNSNGLTLSGTDIKLHAATISTPGGVNVGQQTFGVGADTKIFNGTGSGQITVDGNTDNTVAGINFTQQGTDLMGIVHMNSSDADNAQLRLALEQDGGLVDQMTIGTLNDSKGMYSRNGLYEDITTVTTSPYTVLYGDRNIYLDGTTITVNLQAIGTSTAETKIGRVIYFFNDNATNVTITPNGSETINDSASLTLLPNTGVTLLAVTGTKWVTRD